MVYIIEEYMYILAKLGVAVGFDVSYSINGSNKMVGYESLCLIRVRSIKDGTLRFGHIAREEEMASNVCR